MFWATIVDYLDEDSQDIHAFKTLETHNVTRPTDVDNPIVIKLIWFAAVERLKRFTEDLDKSYWPVWFILSNAESQIGLKKLSWRSAI